LSDVTEERGAAAPELHDRRRLRSARLLAVGGAALGVLGAAAVGLAGATGGFGLLALLLGVLVGFVIAAAHLAGFALVDEIKKRPVATRRPIEALVFFLAALFLMLLVMGAAGALGAADREATDGGAVTAP
jgi:drug/metabolite transporter (DMT)-like permease